MNRKKLKEIKDYIEKSGLSSASPDDPYLLKDYCEQLIKELQDRKASYTFHMACLMTICITMLIAAWLL